MNEIEEPTPAEWKVLTVVWERGRVAARDVVEALAEDTGWSASTVKTLLRRLVEKGHLTTEAAGSSYLYSPARPPLRTLRRSAEALLERAVDGAVGPLLAHLVRRSRLSARDLDELRDLIERKSPPREGEEEPR
jgi:BlaI family penicillinase repressor